MVWWCDGCQARCRFSLSLSAQCVTPFFYECNSPLECELLLISTPWNCVTQYDVLHDTAIYWGAIWCGLGRVRPQTCKYLYKYWNNEKNCLYTLKKTLPIKVFFLWRRPSTLRGSLNCVWMSLKWGGERVAQVSVSLAQQGWPWPNYKTWVKRVEDQCCCAIQRAILCPLSLPLGRFKPTVGTGILITVY